MICGALQFLIAADDSGLSMEPFRETAQKEFRMQVRHYYLYLTLYCLGLGLLEKQ
jgi:predicted ABC-class ATPase